jgi:hypothetical protein
VPFEPDSERLPEVFARVCQSRLTISMIFGLKQFLRFDVVECFKRDHEIVINLQSTKSPQERNAYLVEVSEGAVSSRKGIRCCHFETTISVSTPRCDSTSSPRKSFVRMACSQRLSKSTARLVSAATFSIDVKASSIRLQISSCSSGDGRRSSILERSHCETFQIPAVVLAAHSICVLTWGAFQIDTNHAGLARCVASRIRKAVSGKIVGWVTC